MLNENLIAVLAALLAFITIIYNPTNTDIIKLVIVAFLGFISGRRFEYASKNSIVKDKDKDEEK